MCVRDAQIGSGTFSARVPGLLAGAREGDESAGAVVAIDAKDYQEFGAGKGAEGSGKAVPRR